MARSEGSFTQATHLLKVIDDEKPSAEKYQGLVENSDLLARLASHGDTLKTVSRGSFDQVLRPPGDFWASLHLNPFSGEFTEPIRDKHKEITRPSNYLTFPAGCYQRAFGATLNDQFLEQQEVARPEIPEGADGFVCWPKLAAIGEKLSLPDPYDLDYGSCLRHVLSRMSSLRSLYISENCRGLNAAQLRPLPSITRLYREWESKTKGAFMVAAVQLGGLYAGCSPRSARYQMINSGQFPLDPYVVACLMVADPHLLYREDTHVDCPGAEYSRRADEPRDYILTFENGKETPVMDLFHESAHPAKIQCASGFLPKGMSLKF